MLTAILISVFFIIFPFFINVSAVYINEFRKLFFRIDLFGFIKVFFGKIYLDFNGLILEYNNKRKIIKIKKDTFSKDNIKKLSGYHVVSLSSLIELGGKNSNLIFGSVVSINFINNILINLLAHKKPYLKINTKVNLYLDKKIFNHFIKVQIIMNLFTIIINLINNLVRNIKNGKEQ